MKVKETCCCGATFEAEEDGLWAGMDIKWRYEDFLEAHAVCRHKKQLEPNQEQP